MHHADDDMTKYLFRFRNSQKLNELCHRRPIIRGGQEHGMNILYPLHFTGFDVLKDHDNKESEISGEKMLCAILYLENSDKTRFSDLKKRVDDDYILNKSEQPRTVTALQSLILNDQTTYNYNSEYQSKGVINQRMFSQCGKNGDYEGETNDDKQYPQSNLDHIICNYCG